MQAQQECPRYEKKEIRIHPYQPCVKSLCRDGLKRLSSSRILLWQCLVSLVPLTVMIYLHLQSFWMAEYIRQINQLCQSPHSLEMETSMLNSNTDKMSRRMLYDKTAQQQLCGLWCWNSWLPGSNLYMLVDLIWLDHQHQQHGMGTIYGIHHNPDWVHKCHDDQRHVHQTQW